MVRVVVLFKRVYYFHLFRVGEAGSLRPESGKRQLRGALWGCYHFPHVLRAEGCQGDEYAALAAAERAAYTVATPHHTTPGLDAKRR